MGVIVCLVLPQSYCIYPNLWVSIIGVVDVEISVALEIDTRQMGFHNLYMQQQNQPTTSSCCGRHSYNEAIYFMNSHLNNPLNICNLADSAL